ncbi:MAG: HAMP domain-containing histidine kinase [Actinomycetota bacterium]|nr:HAMP domain-containing histidine kinase [Actinomycetota bacterium]
MVVTIASMILVALLVPMAVLIQRFAFEDALAAASLEVHATETVVSFRERADLVTLLEILNADAEHRRTTVLFADGDAIGPDRNVTDDVQRARVTGQAISNDTEQGAEILVPVARGAKPGDPENATPDPNHIAVIRVIINSDVVNREVLVSWAIITALGLGLLALAILVANRLAHRLLRPVNALAHTAEELEAGRLEARADITGPPELREVGQALNRLAGRIRELLAAERESVADISHRLRTPIAAVRLEAEQLTDPDERNTMTAGIDSVSRELGHVIQEARRPMREGLGASCDAAAVVRERTEFWSVLAEDQHRSMRVTVPPEPVPVKVAAGDLAAAVDALLENVFAHTAEGVAFDVLIVKSGNGHGGASLIVADHGEGFPNASAVLHRGISGAGSTGLGMDIVRRTAEASGGRVVVENSPVGGARVIADLGAPETR